MENFHSLYNVTVTSGGQLHYVVGHQIASLLITMTFKNVTQDFGKYQDVITLRLLLHNIYQNHSYIPLLQDSNPN